MFNIGDKVMFNVAKYEDSFNADILVEIAGIHESKYDDDEYLIFLLFEHKHQMLLDIDAINSYEDADGYNINADCKVRPIYDMWIPASRLYLDDGRSNSLEDDCGGLRYL